MTRRLADHVLIDIDTRADRGRHSRIRRRRGGSPDAHLNATLTPFSPEVHRAEDSHDALTLCRRPGVAIGGSNATRVVEDDRESERDPTGAGANLRVELANEILHLLVAPHLGSRGTRPGFAAARRGGRVDPDSGPRSSDVTIDPT
jgi:hypothetical protein